MCFLDLQEKRNDKDYDEVVEDQLIDEGDKDTYILSKVTEVIHSLLAAYRCDFLPGLNNLIPHVVRLLGSDRSSDRQCGICVFGYVIEFAGVLELLKDNGPEVIKVFTLYANQLLIPFSIPIFRSGRQLSISWVFWACTAHLFLLMRVRKQFRH